MEAETGYVVPASGTYPHSRRRSSLLLQLGVVRVPNNDPHER